MNQRNMWRWHGSFSYLIFFLLLQKVFFLYFCERLFELGSSIWLIYEIFEFSAFLYEWISFSWGSVVIYGYNFLFRSGLQGALKSVLVLLKLYRKLAKVMEVMIFIWSFLYRLQEWFEISSRLGPCKKIRWSDMFCADFLCDRARAVINQSLTFSRKCPTSKMSILGSRYVILKNISS